MQFITTDSKRVDDGVKVDQVACKLLDVVLQPIVLSRVQCTMSASIGIALFPVDASDAEQLLRHADQAMYLAKESGRNRFA